MLIDELVDWNIILASSSPRRKELLKKLGLSFKQVDISFSESFPDGLGNLETAKYLAMRKSEQARELVLERNIVITADTIVCLGTRIMGKPENREEAISILKQLSGKRHNVITGVCLSASKLRTCFVASTEVLFSKLEEREIEHYVDKYKPFDKAGAYGIQEWIGYIGIEEITGSYFNVMGLPVQSLYKEMKCFIKELKRIK